MRTPADEDDAFDASEWDRRSGGSDRQWPRELDATSGREKPAKRVKRGER
jgi:hypothetical protein